MWFKKKLNITSALKGDYVVVIHNWHVYSKGFDNYILRGKTKEEVELFAKAKSFELNVNFNNTAYTIVEFKDE